MKSLYALSALAVLAWASTAKAQILESNTTYTTGQSYYFGQSFTTPDDGTSDILSGFTWLETTTVHNGAGNLYLFSQAYTGSPTDLSLSDTGALAEAAWNSTSKEYDFSLDNITLQPDTEYYVYSDSKVLARWNASGTDVFPGGDEYVTSSPSDPTSDFVVVPGQDMAFEVFAAAPTPEPSTFALGGLGVVAFFVMRKFPRRN